MFGYTVPSYVSMSASDLYAYRSCYCESCHQLRRNFGLISTMAVNYDMTFNAIVLNSLSPDGAEEQNTGNGIICVLGRAVDSELLRKIAGYTLLLTKWELEDDRLDGPGLRSNAASLVLGRAIRKAEKIYPEYDDHVGKGFEALRDAEERGCADAVGIGGMFASSLMPAMRDIAGDSWSDDLEKLFTGIGTAVYVMDAVDDLDEDLVNGTFNPFLRGSEDHVNKERFIQKNVYRITDTFGPVMKSVQDSYNAVRGSMHFHHGVSDNIIFRGMPESIKRIMTCGCQARPGIRNSISSRMLRREV